MNKCGFCESEVKKKFCSVSCQAKYRQSEIIRKWKAGEISGNNIWNISHTIRAYLYKKSGEKCSKCGWDKKNPSTGKCPLEVSHIDGDWQNNKEENLEVICPNCHALSPSHRALNKGKGRHSFIKARNKSRYGH